MINGRTGFQDKNGSNGTKRIWYLFNSKKGKIEQVFHSKKFADYVFMKEKSKDTILRRLPVPAKWTNLSAEQRHAYWKSRFNTAPQKLSEICRTNQLNRTLIQIKNLPINMSIGTITKEGEPRTWQVSRLSEDSLKILLYQENGEPDVIQFQRGLLLKLLKEYKDLFEDIFLLLDYVAVSLPIRWESKTNPREWRTYCPECDSLIIAESHQGEACHIKCNCGFQKKVLFYDGGVCVTREDISAVNEIEKCKQPFYSKGSRSEIEKWNQKKSEV